VKGLFVAGTDTGVGKTYISCSLLRQFAGTGIRVVGMKPVAAGCTLIDGRWVNDDLEALREASTIEADATLMSPYQLEQACSPHLAASAEAVTIDPARIRTDLEKLTYLADLVIVEATGGWLSPISETETMQDIAIALDLPVLMVVAVRLGCLSHSLLTAQAIQSAGLDMAGWVANYPEPMLSRDLPVENTLIERLQAPFLGAVLYNQGQDRMTGLDIDMISK
jgi:dethiobiotin synthetase